MKLPHGYRGVLNSVCSKYGDILENPHLDVDRNLLIATDGRVLVVIPVIVEEDEVSGPVPLKAIRVWMDGTKRNQAVHSKTQPVSMHCGTRVVVTAYDGEQISYPRSQGKFPQWQLQFATVPEGKPTICLNAQLLANAQKALGSDFVSIWIQDGGKPIFVADSTSPYLALVMPAKELRTSAPTLDSLKAF